MDSVKTYDVTQDEPPVCVHCGGQHEDFMACAKDPNYDGAPYCSDCGARERRFCKCPPRPRND